MLETTFRTSSGITRVIDAVTLPGGDLSPQREVVRAVDAAGCGPSSRCVDEADAFFWWLLQASQLTHPHQKVLYRLDSGPQAREWTLPLAGYRGYTLSVDDLRRFSRSASAWRAMARFVRAPRDLVDRVAGVLDRHDRFTASTTRK